MDTVSFTRMADGTREDYEFLARHEHEFAAGLPDRLIASLGKLRNSFGGYQIDRLQHSLQSATRAYDNGEPEELVVAALLHDIGDDLAPFSHSELAAAIIRPYVSEKTWWIIKHHGIFQMYYYAHHTGGNRDARDQYTDHPWYQDTVDFCENYDQNCFDPDHDDKPLSFFEPMIRRVFGKAPFGELQRAAEA